MFEDVCCFCGGGKDDGGGGDTSSVESWGKEQERSKDQSKPKTLKRHSIG
jgi:hypothetical protein